MSVNRDISQYENKLHHVQYRERRCLARPCPAWSRSTMHWRDCKEGWRRWWELVELFPYMGKEGRKQSRMKTDARIEPTREGGARRLKRICLGVKDDCYDGEAIALTSPHRVFMMSWKCVDQWPAHTHWGSPLTPWVKTRSEAVCVHEHWQQYAQWVALRLNCTESLDSLGALLRKNM